MIGLSSPGYVAFTLVSRVKAVLLLREWAGLAGYVAFTFVSRVKAALLLFEWAELAGVCSFQFGQYTQGCTSIT